MLVVPWKLLCCSLLTPYQARGLCCLTPAKGVWRTSRNPNRGGDGHPQEASPGLWEDAPVVSRDGLMPSPQPGCLRPGATRGGAGQAQHAEHGDALQASGRRFWISSLDSFSQGAHENCCLKILEMLYPALQNIHSLGFSSHQLSPTAVGRNSSADSAQMLKHSL